MGLVSGWSLANHSNLESFLWRTHCSAKMDASERDSGKWMDTRCLLSTFPELVWLVVGLLVSYSLSESPVTKQLMQMVTMVPGQGGRFQSVCFP